MADPDGNLDPQPRRGLSVPSIQRGTVAHWAIQAIRFARMCARQALGLFVALVIIFEEWGWRPLAAALGLLARFQPIAWIEQRITELPAWASICVFVAPTLLFLPLKLAAIWLIAAGHMLTATALFAFAKVAGTALFARIFQLTQPRLMEIAWFARLYNWFLPWKEHLLEQARATPVWKSAVRLKVAMKHIATETWDRLRPSANAFLVRIRAAFGR